jgi:adenylate cyclase class 2
MPTLGHREEIEIKLAVRNLRDLRALLKRLRAREISPRTYETNTLYDTPAQNLRRRGQLLRIRTEQPAASFRTAASEDGGQAILTYKGPPARASRLGKTGNGPSRRHRYKIRDEAEIRAAGAGELARILRALGLQPLFRYEKFRTTYTLPGVPGLKIELDETPVGTYLELEGSIAGIDRAARLLGYTRRDYLTDSYGGLYLAECRRRGQKPGHMLFSPTKKSL